ncbi:MAG: NnrS family protein [Thiohalorhabdaceae bacterium]
MPRLSVYHVLFPAAALWALVAVGLKAGASAGWLMVPGHWPVGWHGHELIFGFAFGVVGGYLLTRLRTPGTLVTLGTWILGRFATLGPAMPPGVSAAMALAFPLMLFLGAGLPLAKAAKKPRNRVFGPLLAGMGLAEVAYQLGILGILPGGPASGLLLGADLLGLLLFVMGGRFLATVASGLHQARGRWLVRLSQPRLEGAGVAALAAMAILDFLAAAAGLRPQIPGLLALLGAGLIACRLAGWQGWRLLKDPGITALQAGYLWLGLGLAFKGGGQLAGQGLSVVGIHVLLVGGLGTLTLTVMTRVIRNRQGLRPSLSATGTMAAVLVSVAAVTRVAGWAGTDQTLWLGVAGVAWCLAWVLFLVELVRDTLFGHAS